jgi:hypothetical protein
MTSPLCSIRTTNCAFTTRTRALGLPCLLATALLVACTDSGGDAPADRDAGESAVVDPQTAEDAGSDGVASPEDAGERDGGNKAMDAGQVGHHAKDAGPSTVTDARGPGSADAGTDADLAELGDASDSAAPVAPRDAGQRPDAATAAASIYDDDAKWLCRPGLPNNPCAQTVQVTEVHPDGGTTVSELPKTPADAEADCLYLYPTVDPGLLTPPRNLDFGQIDMAAVRDIFAGQGLPFREACAVWAPVYRQTSLNSFEQADTREKGLATAFRDVEAAFDYYLSHATPGRPIVIVAHSQGAIVMTRLLKQRFEGQPELLRRLVVAVLAGPLGGFVVPQDELVGGTLQEIPLCSTDEQTGCALTFATFSAKIPPNADYGRVNGGVAAGFDTGCTTPPGGLDGRDARLSGTLFASIGGALGALAPQFDYGRTRVRTQLVRYADFYTASCEKSGTGLSYLKVTAAPLPGDVRVDPVLYNSTTLSSPEIGLHGLDYAFVSGDLVRTVKTRVAAHVR